MSLTSLPVRRETPAYRYIGRLVRDAQAAALKQGLTQLNITNPSRRSRARSTLKPNRLFTSVVMPRRAIIVRTAAR